MDTTNRQIIHLNKNVVLVPGYTSGAIYNFDNQKVYSINHESLSLLSDMLNDGFKTNDKQDAFIKQLVELNLFSGKYFGKPFEYKEQSFNRFKTVWLELTMGCNCRCIHCYEGETHQVLSKRLSLNEWFDVIDQINNIGADRIILIGGEPCLYADLIKIIEKISECNIEMTLFTNATLIDDALLNAIVKHHVRVKVSLYGHNKQIHESVTCLSGSFDKMSSNIKKLKDKGVEVVPSIIVMKNNQDYIEELKRFVEELGMPWTGYDVVRCVGCGKNPHYFPRSDIYDKKIRRKPSFYADKDFFIETISHNNCWNDKIVISENGDVFPCVFARSQICGNVLKSSIKEIMNNNLTKYWNYDYSQIETCKDCEYRFACKDCRPVAMSESNDISAHTSYCKYNPYKGEWNNDD